MWRDGDVARETTGGCDVALRPRGRAAGGPRVAHEGQVYTCHEYNTFNISLFLELANNIMRLPI